MRRKVARYLRDASGREEEKKMIGQDGTGRNRMGPYRTGWNGEGAMMPVDGNKEEEEGDGEGVKWNENSPKTHSVEQCVPPVLGAPNVGWNASSRSVPSRPMYQAVPCRTLDNLYESRKGFGSS
ncbi:hypothetical protein DVH24_033910 [Malus domestica]|uniref:Uncharacterized protein n=1 Tax=Malus domestica TaxID=3750 RepID=A0A498KWI7_MALDO|nr:hypothetical protein DVH24_033910 [Malus domestica]